MQYNNGVVNKLPIKEKVLVKKKRYFTYFVFTIQNKVLVSKRVEKDIWQNLYEFYLFETMKKPAWNDIELDDWVKGQMGILEYEVKQITHIFKQQLTHQNIEGQFIIVALKTIPESLKYLTKIDISGLHKFAFPKFINQYLETGFANDLTS